jgi:hypothetical protein
VSVSKPIKKILSIVGIGLLFATANLLMSSDESAAQNVVFPSDSGVIDVTKSPYNAIPNDGKDDTTAIQRALSQEANGNRIIYLPNGTYLVSDRLNWPQGDRGGLHQKRTIVQGQSQDGAVIKLQDSAPGYQDPDHPKAVIWTGEAPAQRFRNAIRNLSVNTGSGNPGASGIQFIANNQGGIRNVKIISEDCQGKIGLDMSYTEEIGPLLVRGLHVDGFDIGIRTYWQTASVTFEDVTLKNQNVFGWENYGQMTFIRGLKSNNAVPALKNVKDNPSHVVLVDANLAGIGKASSKPAIWNQKSMYLRNLTTSGYETSVKHDDKGRGNEPGISASEVEQWLSHRNPKHLFDTREGSLNLPIEETPKVQWDALSEWATPLDFGGQPDDEVDDTKAIQAAIDSGATTVYLPNGNWRVEDEVKLRGNVQRFLGTEAQLAGSGTITLADGTAPVVVVERMEIEDGATFVHDSERAWVLSSLQNPNYANTSTGTGDLFIDDVVFANPVVFRNQNVWARQLNQETNTQQTSDDAKIINDGGSLWVLGLKTERPGTIVKTINGGRTEVLGAFLYSTGGEKIDPAFINNQSAICLVGLAERSFQDNPIQTWVRETRNGETRTLDTLGKAVLYVGY